MESQEHFFDFAAEVGLTKHLGGVGATQELVSLCHIGAGSYVLDVGCGAGATPAFLVKQVGCRVVGVDISASMVRRSQERAARERITGRAEFRVADAQDLPFEDGLFDAVITESVTALTADQARAVGEYVRVAKPGGYVGLNESTWLQVPPPPDMLAWVAQDVGATVAPLTADEWQGRLADAGLRDIVVQLFEIDVQNEAKGIVRRYGWRGMLRVLLRTLRLYARNPRYRRFVKEVQQRGITPDGLHEYFGYGLYVGRK
jgi:arsenite methyltransferase